MDGTVQRLESGAESGLDAGNFDVGGSHQILIDFSLQGDDLPRFLPAQFPVDLKKHFFVALEVQVESQGGQWPKRTKIRLDSGVVRKFLFFDVRIVCGMEPNIFDGNLLGNSVWNQQCGILDLSVRSSGNTRRRISGQWSAKDKVSLSSVWILTFAERKSPCQEASNVPDVFLSMNFPWAF